MRMRFLGFVDEGIHKDDEIDRFKLEAMKPGPKLPILIDHMCDDAVHLHPRTQSNVRL
jgi:hypothetical protein